ncbi:MAG: hypothetical protein OXG96_00755 [Acidobacteria bacterium]|nr:hypothetical protein [Acidobacteriota bacterium]
MTGSAGNAMVGVHLALMALVVFLLPVFCQVWAYESHKAELFWLSLGLNADSLMGQAVVISVWSCTRTAVPREIAHQLQRRDDPEVRP